MSYLNRTQDPRRRSAAIVAVAAIHALLAVALLKGLDVDFKKIVGGHVEATNIPLKPPPPPPPAKQDDPVTIRDQIVVPPLPPIDLHPDPVDHLDVTDTVIPEVTGGVETNRLVIPTPTPSVAPSFTPRSPVPSNDKARWITNSDYPAPALRNEAEGTVGYRLVVGSNGRVSACEITRSSGNALLDQTSCRLIERRARFDAASDQTGAKVVGNYSGTVRWEIPD